jgi:hypothetical protein
MRQRKKNDSFPSCRLRALPFLIITAISQQIHAEETQVSKPKSKRLTQAVAHLETQNALLTYDLDIGRNYLALALLMKISKPLDK